MEDGKVRGPTSKRRKRLLFSSPTLTGAHICTAPSPLLCYWQLVYRFTHCYTNSYLNLRYFLYVTKFMWQFASALLASLTLTQRQTHKAITVIIQAFIFQNIKGDPSKIASKLFFIAPA